MKKIDSAAALAVRLLAAVTAAALTLALLSSCAGGSGGATETDGDTTEAYTASAGETAEISANRSVGDLNIAINTVLWFEDSGSEAESGIGNIVSNLYNMSVELFADDTGARLFSSDVLGRGEALGGIKLLEALEQGDHAATAVFSATDPNGGKEIGRTAAAVTVKVGGEKPDDLLRMSATVPVQITIYVQPDGSTDVTEGNDIINHSAYPIYVSGVTAAADGFEIVSFEEAYSAAEGEKKLGLQVYGVNWQGAEELNGAPNWSEVDRRYYGAVPGTLLYPDADDVSLESRLQGVPVFAVAAPTAEDGEKYEIDIRAAYRLCIDTQAEDFMNSAVDFEGF